MSELMSQTNNSLEMRVIKRNCELEDIAFDKILNRIKTLGQEANININYSSLVMKVIDQLYDNIPTTKIDELAAEQCASLSTDNPDYATLASRIIISNHQKNTEPKFCNVVEKLYNFYDSNKNQVKLVSDNLYEFVKTYENEIEDMINHDRDYLIDYFGFKTLERSYLFRLNGKSVERIQHMWMRVAIGIHGDVETKNYNHTLELIKETYDLMSLKYFTHATPTLFNAGTPNSQMSSCYLVAMEDDSLDGIFNTLRDCARISKWAGGIGLHIHNIRGNNSLIRGTNGQSSGIVPMLKMFNDSARFINQGGKRNGSVAIYLEPWHPDIEDFLNLKKNHGDEEMRARDLFYALWIPDLFMERIRDGGKWSLFCPNECPGLSDVYGYQFKELYEKYEKEGKSRKTVNAREIWFKVLDAQMETGTPYLCYKDAANIKSNQKNLGTIKSSNLCVAPETVILTDKGHIEIQELEGQQVNVWNGEEFSEVTVVKTGEDQELIDVYTDDGSKLTCTPYHKFYIQENYSENSIKQVEAKDLKYDDKLITCNYPVISGNENFILDNFSITIPSYTCSIQNKLEWFTNYCDTTDCEIKNDQLIAYSINKEYIQKVKLFLQTCGINPRIKLFLRKTNTSFPECYCLIITKNDLYELVQLGFSPKRLKINGNKPSRNSNQFIKILKIEYNNRIDDTYCFTEPKNHMGIFNGIITGQCTEITEYSDENETAVCNLASIALPTFVNKDTKEFNYEQLHSVTKVITNNLNRVIDINFYPTTKTKASNFLHRPIGIGVQGLADTFVLMDIAFHSDKAKEVNKLIFETIYHASLEKSNEIAKEIKSKRKIDDNVIIYSQYDKDKKYELLGKHFGAYQSFEGSPASKGILQFDMWGVQPTPDRYNWVDLKLSIVEHGLVNSLLIAPMPTASTSQILGFNECFEPFTSNIYSRRTLAGEFIVVNKYLMRELIDLGFWNKKLKDNIIANNGSIQHLDFLPEHLREKYKIVWEIPMKHLIDMAADRGAFICQSQSMNLWLEDPTYNTLTSMHFYSWKKGLKTGIYYLRRKPKHQAQKFTIEPELKEKSQVVETEEDEICEMCSA
jgi:ribonucleotide reductase alpha subunit